MEVFKINSTEKFDMIVILEDDNELNDELTGIEEIEHTLENIKIKFYIKESICSNVVLVEFGTNSLEISKMLMNTCTKKISLAIPIDLVVKTDLEAIINNVKDLSFEKTNSGNSFFVNCDIMNYNKLKESNVKNAVKTDLIKSGLKFDEKNPDWNIYVGIIGENTGISVLKSRDFPLVSYTD